MIGDIDKKLLQKRFDASAGTYDKYAVVQKQMTHRLIARMRRSSAWKRISHQPGAKVLEIGSGTGYLTSFLIKELPDADVTAVDLSSAMIGLARQKVAPNTVHFVTADIEEMVLCDRYDLIVSNATFQWFNDFEGTVHKLISSLNTHGGMFFSTFAFGTFKELSDAFAQAQQRIGLSDLESFGPTFYHEEECLAKLNHGLSSLAGRFSIEYEIYDDVQCFSSVMDFLTSVKKIGANNSNTGALRIRPRLMREMISIYDQSHRLDGKITATYRPLLVDIVRN